MKGAERRESLKGEMRKKAAEDKEKIKKGKNEWKWEEMEEERAWPGGR